MLDYLINSKSRLQLLKLIWKEKLEVPVRQLAKLAGLSFSTTYVELISMEKADLVTSVKVGKSRIFYRNSNFKYKKLLLELLSTESDSQFFLDEPKNLTDTDVELNMSEYGAPIGFSGKPNKKLSLEQTLARALKLSHHNPTVARAFPVLLYKNHMTIDIDRLKFFVARLEEEQTLGFFLELTFVLSKIPKLKKWANQLRDKRISKTRDFFKNSEGKFEKLLTEKNTPKIAKKWHYRMNMEIETFKSLFDKFYEVNK